MVAGSASDAALVYAGCPRLPVALAGLASDASLDAAFAWLCKHRRHWPDSADVWGLRFHWPAERARLQQQLRSGQYRFEPLLRVTKPDGEVVHLWSARDALVLKALANALADNLPISPRCAHVKGHGGGKAAVRQAWQHLAEHRFVLKTDVKEYYDSIDQELLIAQLAGYVEEPLLGLLWRALRRTVTWGGIYWDCERGLSRGCPLSPLLAALFLRPLDTAMERLGLLYVRYMDDVLVLAPTRSKLRRAVKVLNRVLASLGLDKHPGKTFIGRIDRGFDFLGYHLVPSGLTVARETYVRFVERAARLYEQGRGAEDPALGQYVRRWEGWARSGMDGVPVSPPSRVLGAALAPPAAQHPEGDNSRR